MVREWRDECRGGDPRPVTPLAIDARNRGTGWWGMAAGNRDPGRTSRFMRRASGQQQDWMRGRSGRVTALPGSQLVVLSAACGVDCWVSACSWLPAWYRVRFRYALLAYAPRRVWLMACGYVGAQLYPDHPESRSPRPNGLANIALVDCEAPPPTLAVPEYAKRRARYALEGARPPRRSSHRARL